MLQAGQWYSAGTAVDDWPDAAAILDTNTITVYLEAAKSQVLAYAPPLDDGAPIPQSYAIAQLMQTRNIWNASKVSPAGNIGDGSFASTPFPLDWMVRQMLRPRRGIPAVW